MCDFLAIKGFLTRQATAEDFMDEDEIQELRREIVKTSKGYDTFGHAAAEQSRRAALSEQSERPGLAALDLSHVIAPVPDSLGEGSCTLHSISITRCSSWRLSTCSPYISWHMPEYRLSTDNTFAIQNQCLSRAWLSWMPYVFTDSDEFLMKIQVLSHDCGSLHNFPYKHMHDL